MSEELRSSPSSFYYHAQLIQEDDHHDQHHQQQSMQQMGGFCSSFSFSSSSTTTSCSSLAASSLFSAQRGFLPLSHDLSSRLINNIPQGFDPYNSFIENLYDGSSADFNSNTNFERSFAAGLSPSSSEAFSSAKDELQKQKQVHETTAGGDQLLGTAGETPITPNASASFSSTEGGPDDQDCNRNSKDQEQQQQKAGNDQDGGENSDKGNKQLKKKVEKKERAPRFAFMTKSEVDHLEDGYRWRKYGQKAVKNSPYPRSYYRCTTQKCTVKKRVERSFQDPSVVITTYEGQHNHHLPSTLRGNVVAGMYSPSILSRAAMAAAGGGIHSSFPHQDFFVQMPSVFAGPTDDDHHHHHHGHTQTLLPHHQIQQQQQQFQIQIPDYGLLQDMVNPSNMFFKQEN